MPEHQQTQQSTELKSTIKRQVTPIQTPVSHPAAIIQRARINPKSLTPADILQLQRTIGNRAVGRLLSEIRSSSKVQQAPIQRQEIPEEEPLQGKMVETIQRQEIPEEEEPLQGKFESVPEKETCPSCMQRQEIPEEEEPLQGKMIKPIQRQEIPEEEEPIQTKTENNTGMPDNLKNGVENLSGIDMSDVRVHYNSDKPAEVGALAYTQDTNIHIAPGQEKHLPHEAWHVVQQAQGRVKPTMQINKIGVNDDEGLEREADIIGERVKHGELIQQYREKQHRPQIVNMNVAKIAQLTIDKDHRTRINSLVELNAALQRLNPRVDPIDLQNIGVIGVTAPMLDAIIKADNSELFDFMDFNEVILLYKAALTRAVNEMLPTFTYDIHGDKHFPGGPAGTKFIKGTKADINRKIEELLKPLIGRIRRDANGQNRTYYYTGDLDPHCPPSYPNLVVQVDYIAATDTINYHGYPADVRVFALSRTIGGSQIPI